MGARGGDAGVEQDLYGFGVGAADRGTQGVGAFGSGTVFQKQAQTRVVALEHRVRLRLTRRPGS
jgi:hypothetical protein